MLIIGAKGFAKEVLDVFHQLGMDNNIAFYDDVNIDDADLLMDKFPILKDENQVLDYFKRNGNEFTIGIGNPKLRYELSRKFINLGGKFVSSISPLASISEFDVQIGKGSNVLLNSVFSSGAKLGEGCLVYYGAIITHDCKIGKFVEISPNAILLGNCQIGSFSKIGANATILPRISIGKNVTIGAGSVVTKNIPDNAVVVGIPAKVIKFSDPLNDEYI